jgi:hypothetical protein
MMLCIQIIEVLKHETAQVDSDRRFLVSSALAVPAMATNFAQPGTVNYAEGQVSIAGQSLNANPAGSVQLETNQSISTGNGRAEILLAPGIVVRIASNSTLTLSSSDWSDTEMRLGSGRAVIEVAQIGKDSRLVVDEGGTPIQILRPGLYDFNVGASQFRVFDGQAIVTLEGRPFTVTRREEFSINDAPKPEQFTDVIRDDSFYQWASLRSQYLAKANLDVARSDESRA